jgi:hypothetical protein
MVLCQALAGGVFLAIPIRLTRIKMRHPEVLLVPVLMLSDYYLTLYGLRLAEQSYLRHFKIPHYELNPIWQRAIARRQWFNRWHAAVLLVGCILVGLAEIMQVDDTLLDPMIGFLLAFYGLLLSQHLSNLLTFSHLNRHPDEVTGEVHLAQTFVLRLSIHQLLPVAAPIAVIAIYSPNEFVLGAMVAVLLMAILKTVWLARARRIHAKKALAGT